MAVNPEIQLTERQVALLRKVVEDYVLSGRPVGSKVLVERSGLRISSSTVRSELAELEEVGLLTHPHTSAGRVPTDRGYRFYVDQLLTRLEPRPSPFPLDLTDVRSEVEEALQATTEMVSQVTHLLTLVSAPALATTTVRHVEVLALQPHVVVVVAITSTGDVGKRVFEFAEPVDTGLVAWAAEYLNERVAGLQLGTHTLRRRFEDPDLALRERAFLAAIKPVFTDLVDEAGERIFVGGAAGLLGEVRADELEACQRLLDILEHRAALLELLREALDPRRPFVRVGGELGHHSLRDVALVGASYGLANRPLGTVTLLGPVRMDYAKAIATVRGAAFELSRYVESLYDES